MKLVILGNGFDLHHGLKTSFSEFRKYLLKNNELNFVNTIDLVIEKHKGDADFSSMCWNDVERYFFAEFNRIRRLPKDSQTKLLDKLEFNIEEFTLKLFEYLKKLSDNVACNKNPIISKEISPSSIILTFNYTNLYKNYSEDNLNTIFHIHGDLSEENLPLIGYYCSITRNPSKSEDYNVLYNYHFLHKPALALKQNGIDFEINLENFAKKHTSTIDEVVVIGFSFGESDEHIFNILESLLIEQQSEANMSYESAEKIPKIKFKIFSYDEDETNATISRIKLKLRKRRFTVKKTGRGFHPPKEYIISFEKINYS